MLYGPIRHEQPMLKVKVCSALSRTLENVFEKVDIVRMNSLEYQIGRGLRPGRAPVNPCRFLRPKYPFVVTSIPTLPVWLSVCAFVRCALLRRKSWANS